VTGTTLADLRAEVMKQLVDTPDGAPLDERTKVVVRYAVCVAPGSLDVTAARPHAEHALDLGLSSDQLHEILMLVSGLGVHTLMEGSRALASVLRDRGESRPERDAARARLWAENVGSAPYWETFERHVPGFLDDLLWLSPEAFTAFMAYCAVPARTRHVDSLTKELVSVAVDSTPMHRYLPGLRLHVDNAIALGAGRRQILEAMELGAAAPPHRGVH
jgi:alkylhydroperoxidase/carboxymuconolactone decarboxylase family protein YurZ